MLGETDTQKEAIDVEADARHVETIVSHLGLKKRGRTPLSLRDFGPRARKRARRAVDGRFGRLVAHSVACTEVRRNWRFRGQDVEPGASFDEHQCATALVRREDPKCSIFGPWRRAGGAPEKHYGGERALKLQDIAWRRPRGKSFVAQRVGPLPVTVFSFPHWPGPPGPLQSTCVPHYLSSPSGVVFFCRIRTNILSS